MKWVPARFGQLGGRIAIEQRPFGRCLPGAVHALSTEGMAVLQGEIRGRQHLGTAR